MIGLLKPSVNQALLFLLLVAVIFLGFYYISFSYNEKNLINEQIMVRKLIIARAESANIEDFFKRFGNSVAVLAQLRSMEKTDINTFRDMEIFVGQHHESDHIGGVVLTDKDGIVIFHSSTSDIKSTGESVRDREYFVWAKSQGKEGEYFISKPIISRLGATTGQVIVAVASPVYKNSEFTGAVVASIKLKSLVDHFFGLMKVSESTEEFVVDEDGKLLFSERYNDFIGAEISKLPMEDKSLSEGILKSISNEGEEGTFQTKSRLIAYKKIKLGTHTWVSVITHPLADVEKLSESSSIRKAAAVILAGFNVLLLGFLIFRKKQA